MLKCAHAQMLKLTSCMVKGEDGVGPVQIGSHDKFYDVPTPQVNLISTLDNLLFEGPMCQALEVHQG